MKKYLSYIFFIFSIIILLFGKRLNLYWGGIATWGLVLLSLTLAAYFTKHIPD